LAPEFDLIHGKRGSALTTPASSISVRSLSGQNRPAPTVDPNELFARRLDAIADLTDGLLDKLLNAAPEAGEITRPSRLLEAMRYASLGGGKRLRPFFVVETARLLNVAEEQALMTAAAIECVHCYSLIHDDLPAMDDDALRRGRPTVHKAFDEATAILAGDSLLTMAFEILSRPETHPDASVRIELVSKLAKAAGLGGMTGGQMLDLAAEGRFENSGKAKHTFEDVKMLQSMKTGALLEFSCTSGGILGGANAEERAALTRYGSAIGEAFQIADDLLDIGGDPETVGKATGKDAAARKATFVSLLGIDGARHRLDALVQEAQSALVPLGKDTGVLNAAAHFVADRRK
jgi:farnesyl diphosphate synthase